MDVLNRAWNVVGAARGSAARRQLWLKRSAAVVALGLLVMLLLAYQTVVQGIVLGGESRRVAVAAHAQGVWRCTAQADPGLREACLSRINTAGRPASSPALAVATEQAPSPARAR